MNETEGLPFEIKRPKLYDIIKIDEEDELLEKSNMEHKTKSQKFKKKIDIHNRHSHKAL
jgi:hypothetical protein